MNDKTAIIAGLIIFLIALTFPVWYTAAAGGKAERPELEKPAHETECIEGKKFMTENHMQMLDEWRMAVVREGEHYYESKLNGKRFEMSLTKTCLKCHTSKANFCDRCHTYADVHPKCWTCHVDPTGN